MARTRANNSMTNVRAHLHITGRVQGVYFRDFTRREALRLGLKGWVRNLPDGRVEAVAEGEEERVEELIRLCHRGPPLAIVRDVRIQREPPTDGFETFTIRY